MTVMTIDRRAMITAFAALPVIGACSGGGATAAEDMKKVPAPTLNPKSTARGQQKAILAGGCFWGVQAVFAHVKGVTRSVSGYAGGTAETADYDLVSAGRTRHAEAVEVTYDPAVVSYGDLLRVFFSVATDPTQLNKQFPDEGPQYRNEIFYIGDEQRRVAQAYIAQLGAAKVYRQPIVTKVSALPAFYQAEPYHQDYLFEHPTATYIVMYDQPKLRALKAMFPDMYRDRPIRLRKA